MADFKKLSDSVSVAAQLEPTDIARAAAAGFATLISNRLDGEAPDQPPVAEIERLAAGAGLDFHHIPIRPTELCSEDLDHFERAAAAGPTLAFCASGLRSALLWALVQARLGEMNIDEILAAARGAGYDFEPRRALLEQQASTASPILKGSDATGGDCAD